MTTTFTGKNKMIFKYSAVGIAAMVVGSLTVILAQNSANTVASGHREICWRQLNRGMASLTRTIPRASRNSQPSS